MRQFPLPPGATREHAHGQQQNLNSDETEFILNAALLPIHRRDPNVLRFIARYLQCREVAQAAKECGLRPEQGRYLRNRPDIDLAIQKLTQKSVMKYGFDAHEVVERVKEIANVDPIEIQNADGSYKKSLADIAPDVRRAIKRMKVKNTYQKDPNGIVVATGEIIDIEFYDKMKSNELLGREKDLFKETRKIEHDVTSNMKDFLLESQERAEARLLNQAREVKDANDLDSRD